MATVVSGEFEVKVSPQKPDNPEAESAGLGRMSLDKRFHGALEATSKGEMLSIMTEVKGSGVYLAIERVSGTLDGRSGTFILHHRGIMTGGTAGAQHKCCTGFRHRRADSTDRRHANQNAWREKFLEFSYALPEPLTVNSVA
jgi:hypothetical protein